MGIGRTPHRAETAPPVRPAGRAAALQVHHLTKRYGRVSAVQDLSFLVPVGRVTGFLGPNGAGKSTTLRMVLGLDRPTSGIATINGHRLAELPHPMRTVGALLDARAVHPRRSAYNHLLAIARNGHLPPTRVREMLELVGLGDVAERPAGGYSLGMKQRLGIAAALIGDPDIIILDEPLNGLDPEGIRWARSLMHRLAAEGRTILFSSHLMGEMEVTADHLIVINHGGLVADQPLSEFITEHTTQRVVVRVPDRDALRAVVVHAGFTPADCGPDGLSIPDATTDQIGHAAAMAGIELAELTNQRDSLESAFLRLTTLPPQNEAS